MTSQPDLPPGPTSPLPFATRFWLAWVCLWNVLIDGVFASDVRRVQQLRRLRGDNIGATELQLSSRATPAPVRESPLSSPTAPAPASASLLSSPTAPAPASASPLSSAAAPVAPAVPDPAPALQLLALLQREGRLVDFLQQDITPFTDAQVGQVARVVHTGCRKAVAAHAHIEPVFAQAEATRIELPAGFDPAAVKLTGQVQGAAPYRGTLRHRGWRATRLALPTALPGHDAHILAPAEVEL